MNTLMFVFDRYNVNLKEAQDFGIKKGIVTGLGMGTLQIIMFGSYALSFWLVNYK